MITVDTPTTIFFVIVISFFVLHYILRGFGESGIYGVITGLIKRIKNRGT